MFGPCLLLGLSGSKNTCLELQKINDLLLCSGHPGFSAGLTLVSIHVILCYSIFTNNEAVLFWPISIAKLHETVPLFEGHKSTDCSTTV